MTGKMRPICSDGIRWWLRKNPMYLMSAGCIAYGAREMLVLPGSIAGDVSFILLTLVVLQCYEWSVTGFLLILHRSGRSPEDKPSLLLSRP